MCWYRAVGWSFWGKRFLSNNFVCVCTMSISSGAVSLDWRQQTDAGCDLYTLLEWVLFGASLTWSLPKCLLLGQTALQFLIRLCYGCSPCHLCHLIFRTVCSILAVLSFEWDQCSAQLVHAFPLTLLAYSFVFMHITLRLTLAFVTNIYSTSHPLLWRGLDRFVFLIEEKSPMHYFSALLIECFLSCSSCQWGSCEMFWC